MCRETVWDDAHNMVYTQQTWYKGQDHPRQNFSDHPVEKKTLSKFWIKTISRFYYNYILLDTFSTYKR